MSDDAHAAREAFEAWLGYAPERHSDGTYDSGFTDEDFRVWLAAWSASRSISAAAALLRAAGWRVEEPKATCPDCGQHDWHAPTCNGTGARS